MRGDERLWFEPLVHSLGRPAAKFANVLVHDYDLAEEIVQEAFTRMWESPNTPSDAVEFRRYLYRVITNLAHDHHRRLARHTSVYAAVPAPPDPLEVVEQRAGDAAMKDALRTLGLRERQAIYLRYFEDQPYAEIARIMQASQVAVRVMVFRALGKLRRGLETSRISGQVAS